MRSAGYNGVTKTITKYEFTKELENMNIQLTDDQIRSLKKVLDPNQLNMYSMAEFFRDADSKQSERKKVN